MDFKKIEQITNKVKKINEAIVKVDEAITNLSQLSGKITNIEFEFSGESEGGFGIEPGEWVTMGTTLNCKYFGINEEFFNNAFKEAIIKRLNLLKDDLIVQIEMLKTDMKKLV